MLIKKIFRTESADQEKTDRYLITYADLITLLLGLFVILYASAQVDEEKFKEYSKAFSNFFEDGKNSVLKGSNGVLNGFKGTLPGPVNPKKPNKTLDQVASETQTALKKYMDDGTIMLKRTDKELILTLSEKLLFESAKAEIRDEGLKVIDSISNVLRGMEFQITVDGHTDSKPIKTFRYESNWHLSVARALNVAYLLIKNGVPEKNMVIRGFGAQRPVADNTTPEGQARNRRVEITITELPENALSTEGYSSGDSAAANKRKL